MTLPMLDRIAELERRLSLVEAFLDGELRERQGLLLDDIRKLWRARLAVIEATTAARKPSLGRADHSHSANSGK